MSDSIAGKWMYSCYASRFHFFPDGSLRSICGFHSPNFFWGSVTPTDFVPQCKKCLKVLDKIQSKEPKDA